MAELDIRLIGLQAYLSASHSSLFEARDSYYEFDEDTKSQVKRTRQVPLYVEVQNDLIAVPFGAVLHLIQGGMRVQLKEISQLPFTPLNAERDCWGLWNYLREHQREAFKKIASARVGMVEVPTGGGKSPLQVLDAYLASLQHNVFFLSPGEVVKDNFLKRHKQLQNDLGMDLGRVITHAEWRQKVASGSRVPERGYIVVSGAAEVVNDVMNGLNFDTFGTVVADEAHHWAEEGWQRLLRALPRLCRSHSYSGSPLEGAAKSRFTTIPVSDARVLAAGGPVVYRITPQQISSIVNIPEVLNLRFAWDRDKVPRSNSWMHIYGAVKRNVLRSRLIAEVAAGCIALGRRTLVPVREKGHAKTLAKMTGSDKVACWFGGGVYFDHTGSESIKSVEQVSELIVSGRVLCLFVSTHVDESLDIPAIDTTFLTEGKKKRRLKQRVGRAVRKSDTQSFMINLWDVDFPLLAFQSKFRSESITEYYQCAKYAFNEPAQLLQYIASTNRPDPLPEDGGNG